MATDEIRHIISIEADLAKIQTQIKGLEGDFNRGFRGIESAALGLGRQLLGVFSITAIVGFGKSVVDLADHLQDLSEQTGISGQLLSGMKSTIEEAGSSLDAFAKGIFTAQKNLGQANSETDAAAVAAKTLGLNLDELRNSSPEQFLQKVAKALNDIKNPLQFNALGAQLLGRSFQELGPAIRGLGDDIEKFRRQGISDEDIKKLSDFNDGWTRFTNTLKIDTVKTLSTIAELIRENIALFALFRSSAGAGALIGGIKDKLGTAGLEDALKQSLKPEKAPFKPPIDLAALKKAQEEARKLAEESFKGIVEALEAEEKAGTAAGRAIIEVFGEMRKLALAPAEQELAEINKRFDEMILKLREAGAATGQTFGLQIEQLNELRKQTQLQAEFKKPGQFNPFGDVSGLAVDFDAQFAQLEERLTRNSALAQVFGKDFDLLRVNFDATRAAMEELISGGFDPLDPAFQQLKEQFDALKASIGDRTEWDTLVSGVTGAINSTLDGVLRGTQTWGEAWQNMLRNIAIGAANQFSKNFINGINEALQNIEIKTPGGGGGFFGGFFGKLVTGLLSNIGGLFGGSTIDPTHLFPDVSLFQHGGIVRAPTLAMIGEAGPEAVVPLSKMGGGNFGRPVLNVEYMDFRGAAPGVSREVRRAINEMGAIAVKTSVSAVRDERLRSSNYAKSFGD